MALDLTQLITDFHAYFLGLYHQAAAPAAGPPGTEPTAGGPATVPPANTSPAAVAPFLAFAGLGTPITPEMFMLKDGELFDGLVVEQFSMLANALPTIEDGSILGAGLLTADGLYSMILDQSQALAASDMEAFGAIKRHAQQAFDATLPALTPGVGEYHPALPTPKDWPFPSAATAWSSRSFEQTETVVVAPPPPKIPPGQSPPIVVFPQKLVPQALAPRPWTWRVAPEELVDKLHSVEAAQNSVPPRQVVLPPAELETRPVALRPMLSAAMAMRTEPTAPVGRAVAKPAAGRPRPMAAAAAAPTAMLRPAPVLEPSRAVAATFMRSDAVMLRAAELSQRSAPQAVTARSLKLSFDYCLVRATRPWLSTGLLESRGWYVPHTHAGEFASGTGIGGGAFEVMPMAALVVKNLVIEGDWSSDETAILSKADKFGPFSLTGRTLAAEKNSLRCDGMQVVGWVFEPMPQLPPNGDPALG